MKRRTSSLAALSCSLAVLSGCAGAVGSTKSEDRARRTIPIPICLKSLPRHASPGVVSTLTPEDYWSLVLPSFDAEASSVDPNAGDCAGRPLLQAPELAEAEGLHTTLTVKPDAYSVAKGPDGFQVVWLRSHKFADGTFAGPLALVRAKEAYAEAYAIGLFRGAPSTAHFGYERLGPEILVTAADEGCAGVAAGQGCESNVMLFLARDGSLRPAGKVPLDRIRYGTAPSVSGTVQYRLTAAPKYKEKSVVATEQLVLRDSGQNEIRRATLDRTWKLGADGRLLSDVDSLWTDVATGSGAAPAQIPTAATPPKPPPPPPPPPPRH